MRVSDLLYLCVRFRDVFMPFRATRSNETNQITVKSNRQGLVVAQARACASSSWSKLPAMRGTQARVGSAVCLPSSGVMGTLRLDEHVLKLPPKF